MHVTCKKKKNTLPSKWQDQAKSIEENKIVNVVRNKKSNVSCWSYCSHLSKFWSIYHEFGVEVILRCSAFYKKCSKNCLIYFANLIFLFYFKFPVKINILYTGVMGLFLNLWMLCPHILELTEISLFGVDCYLLFSYCSYHLSVIPDRLIGAIFFLLEIRYLFCFMTYLFFFCAMYRAPPLAYFPLLLHWMVLSSVVLYFILLRILSRDHVVFKILTNL